MTEKIELCPICGEPSRVFTLTDKQGIKHYGIACDGGHNPKEFYDTEAEAISVWNSKVISSKSASLGQQIINGLKEAIEAEQHRKCTICG